MNESGQFPPWSSCNYSSFLCSHWYRCTNPSHALMMNQSEHRELEQLKGKSGHSHLLKDAQSIIILSKQLSAGTYCQDWQIKTGFVFLAAIKPVLAESKLVYFDFAEKNLFLLAKPKNKYLQILASKIEAHSIRLVEKAKFPVLGEIFLFRRNSPIFGEIPLKFSSYKALLAIQVHVNHDYCLRADQGISEVT